MKRTALAAVIALGSATTLGADGVQPTQVVYSDGAVEMPLTSAPGDPVVGRDVFANRKLGNCLACHQNGDMAELGFHGEVGPPLDGVGERWTVAELRGIVSNSKMMFEGTIMPAFYVTEGYNRPLEDFEGKSILTAQQVEDVIAYLMTLKY